MSFRFLGNKSKLLPYITEAVTEVVPPTGRPQVLDPFSGTGSVSLALAKIGYRMVSSDLLLSCVTHAQAQLLAEAPLRFEDLFARASLPERPAPNLFSESTPYHKVLAYLNGLPGEKGFFYREYSKEGEPANGVEPRNYFAPQNARKIDAIRSQIAEWGEAEVLRMEERAALLHDLMLATNQVANTAGTYGYFLSNLTKSARQPLRLRPTSFSSGPADHQVIQGDAEEVASSFTADVAYLDPPYNKRQYAAYYHVLETLAHEDAPELIGKSGLRPWQENASDYCYKARASDALASLLQSVDARYIFVSYSEDGHIPHEQMMDLLSERGAVEHLEMNYARYRSNDGGNSVDSLKERLYKVETS